MLEEKDNKKGNLVTCNKSSGGGFTKGKVYKIIEDGTPTWVRVVKDDSGFVNGWHTRYFELHEEEKINKEFEVGSKWIAKCDITSCNEEGEYYGIKKGIVVTVKRIKVITLVFEEGNKSLFFDEALLLLEPYTEPLREMTAEQIAKEFNVKVVE